MNDHDLKVQSIQKKLENWRSSPKFGRQDIHVQSNMMRKREYAAKAPSLGLRALDQVLNIDPQKGVATVEPGVTMEKLVKNTLEYGLIPPVVPEFKGITVGGAINGAALESSAHRFGQFNDTCLSFDVLLGDGTIVKASSQENKDIFYGISGSYGTLGYLLKVEIRLVPTTGWIGLNYTRCNTVKEAIAYMQSLHFQSHPPDVIEAIVYSSSKVMVMWGSSISQNEVQLLPQTSLKFPWHPWFYSHCDQIGESFQNYFEAIPVLDYLFRHDRGAFWMGGYALHPDLVYSYLFSTATSASHAVPKNPGPFFRFLCGWMFKSRTLYSSLHSGGEAWFENRFAIQDFYLSESSVEQFTTWLLERYKITPLWLCPIVSTTTPQFFSPHYRPEKELLFDVGVYGIPYQNNGPDAVREMEKKVHELGGKKMFYCQNYIPQDEFWSIYPEKMYRQLRQKVNLEGLIPDISEKVLK